MVLKKRNCGGESAGVFKASLLLQVMRGSERLCKKLNALIVFKVLQSGLG